MNPWDEQDRDAYRHIEEALSTVELEPAPTGMAQNILRQVRAEARPRFRLTWIDYALSIFTAVMIGLVALLSRSLPPDLARYLNLEVMYWIERVRLDPLRPCLQVGGAALLVGGIAVVAMLSATIVKKEQHQSIE